MLTHTQVASEDETVKEDGNGCKFDRKANFGM